MNPAPTRLVPDLVLAETGWERGRAVTIADGRIMAVGPAEPRQGSDVALEGRALLPGTVNAHCHTFQSLLRGLGDDLDFMAWRDQVLYLKHNLNARALAAIKGELVKVDAQVDQLVKDMNRSIAEADKFIQSMEKESD